MRPIKKVKIGHSQYEDEQKDPTYLEVPVHRNPSVLIAPIDAPPTLPPIPLSSSSLQTSSLPSQAVAERVRELKKLRPFSDFPPSARHLDEFIQPKAVPKECKYLRFVFTKVDIETLAVSIHGSPSQTMLWRFTSPPSHR